MHSIHPHLFTQLMRLPAEQRKDLLELIGAAPVPDLQLAQMIDTLTFRTSKQASRTFPAALNRADRPS